MSKRTVHSIFIFVILVFVSISASGCRNPLKPRPVTEAWGPIVNNSVELLDVKVATQPEMYFNNLAPETVTQHFKLPVGYDTRITFYYQNGDVFSNYNLRPDGERRDHTDPNGTLCDFIAYARGSGTSARSARPSVETMRLRSQTQALTWEEAERDSFYVK